MRDDDDQRPEDQRQHAEHVRLEQRDVVARLERLAHRVQRARADVAVDDAERADGQHEVTAVMCVARAKSWLRRKHVTPKPTLAGPSPAADIFYRFSNEGRGGTGPSFRQELLTNRPMSRISVRGRFARRRRWHRRVAARARDAGRAAGRARRQDQGAVIERLHDRRWSASGHTAVPATTASEAAANGKCETSGGSSAVP